MEENCGSNFPADFLPLTKLLVKVYTGSEGGYFRMFVISHSTLKSRNSALRVTLKRAGADGQHGLIGQNQGRRRCFAPLFRRES